MDLSVACDAVVKASEQLVGAAGRLRQQPTSRQAKTLLFNSAKDIKSGLVHVWKPKEVLHSLNLCVFRF
jgi:hypothetical protein